MANTLFNGTNGTSRRRWGTVWQGIFYLATTVAVAALVILLLNIFDGAFGYVAIQYEKQPADFTTEEGILLDDFDKEALLSVLKDNVSKLLYRQFNRELSFESRSREDVYKLVYEEVLNPTIVKSWNLFESIGNGAAIAAEVNAMDDPAILKFRSWISFDFVTRTSSSVPDDSGMRTGIIGSILIILVTMCVALPIGVGAAIYLEEFAPDNKLTRFIQVNIYNLSGVPSIIYGLLGLAIFVRAMGGATGGSTILSGGFTLALLILPVIIINAQEAIRAVPQTLRDSSFGLGATKWQTIWAHVLPNSFDRILTGAILSISRAIGETAPVVVIGAATFMTKDPSGIFSRFTTMPLQIYDWTTQPAHEFKNVAAAGIIILLVILLSLNAGAIFMREKISKARRSA